MITVIGGSGAIGRQITERLDTEGVPCRVVTRSAGRVDPDPRIEVAEGDVANSAFLDDICRGASALFVLQVGEIDIESLVRSAKSHGVRRLVGVSSLLVETHPESVIGGALTSFEDTVSGFPGECTIVRPWEFTSNTLAWGPDIMASRPVTIPSLGEPSPAVDPRDIGDVAADALLDRTHDGQRHALTGPQWLQVTDKTDILASVLGTNVEVKVDVSLRESIDRDAPDEVVAALSSPGVSGISFEGPLNTVRNLRSVEPRSFREWAVDHVAWFRNG